MTNVADDCRGFTLIEILVVLSLLSLIVVMLPNELESMFTRSRDQALVQETVIAARACSVIAQQKGHSVRLGTDDCPLPENISQSKNNDLLPVFHANGTASHTAYIIVDVGKGAGDRGNAKRIVIDKLTSNVSVIDDALRN